MEIMSAVTELDQLPEEPLEGADIARRIAELASRVVAPSIRTAEELERLIGEFERWLRAGSNCGCTASA
jgi:hypothetical protein